MATARPQLRPGKGWYVVAALMAAAAIAAVVWVGGSLIVDVYNDLADMQRLSVPGEKDLSFAQSGKYVVFHDDQGEEPGEAYEAGPPNDQVSGKLVDASGKEVSLEPVSVNETYSIDGHSGKSIFDFTIERPGTYHLSAVCADGRKAVLAVGRSIDFEPIVWLIMLIPAAILAAFAAIIITIVTAVKRSNCARRLAAAAIPPQIPGQQPPLPL